MAKPFFQSDTKIELPPEMREVLLQSGMSATDITILTDLAQHTMTEIIDKVARACALMPSVDQSMLLFWLLSVAFGDASEGMRKALVKHSLSELNDAKKAGEEHAAKEGKSG